MPPELTLVGDGIENPSNARTMLHAAEMFGAACRFRNRKGLVEAECDPLPLVTREALASEYAPIVACDNFEHAGPIYGFGLPKGPRPALVVGNERRGIADDLRTLAHAAVQIPMISRRLNCLNVAAAAAVGLYYLTRQRSPKLLTRSAPERRRPALLLFGAADHVELGSAIRSAAAFGWTSLLLEDRSGVWFGVDRATRSEGRAAARRGRNPIRLVSARPDQRYAFDEAVVLTTRPTGPSLERADLAGGPRQVVVIPDEGAIDFDAEDWERLARTVRFAQIDLPGRQFVYHYRLLATIGLAEVARQVGRRPEALPGHSARRGLRYRQELDRLAELAGETLFLEELQEY